MKLPAPPIEQATAGAAVQVPFPIGTVFGAGVNYSARSSSGSPAQLLNGQPDPNWQATAVSNYYAAAWGSSGGAAAFYQTNLPFEAQATTPGTTSFNSVNTGPTYLVAYAGIQYSLRVNFTFPWVGTNSIKFLWRELTTMVSGTSTDTWPEGASEPDPPVNVESSSQTYKAMSEIVTPSPGDTFAQTSTYTLDGPALAEGASVTIIGPDDPTFLAPTFQVFTVQQGAAKKGFLPYLVPEPSPGQLVNPQPLYTTETASTAADAPAGTTYSGFQSTVYGQSGEEFVATTAAGPVWFPTQYESSTNTVEQYTPGQEAEDQLCALGQIKNAVSVTPTVVEWPGGLVMTLGNPQATSTITAPVDAALAAVSFIADFPSGQADPATQMTSAIMAVRNLPAHEQTYIARKGVYSIEIYFPINGGLYGLFDAAGNLINNGALTFTWTREVIDLDTGLRTTTQPTWTLPFTGVPGAGPSAPTFKPTTGGSYFVSPYYEEDVPGTNQRIEISGLSVTSGALPCLAIAPQAVVVAAASPAT